MVKQYLLIICRGKSDSGDPERVYNLSSEDFAKYAILKLTGFSGSITLRLDGFFTNLIENDLASHTEMLSGYETISKFEILSN